MGQTNLEGGTIRNVVHEAQFKLRSYKATLAGTLTMAAKHPPLSFLDPGGAGRDILLPPEAEGLVLIIVNTADAAETLTVKEDSNTTTIMTIPGSAAGAANSRAILMCDGTSWFGMVAVDN